MQHKISPKEIANLLIIGILTFLWSISHTISLRAILCSVFVFISLFLYSNRNSFYLLAKTSFIKIYITLTLLIILLAYTTNLSPEDAQHELWSQWLKPGIIGISGFIFASTIKHHYLLLRTIFFSLVGMIILHDLDIIRILILTSNIPFGLSNITEGKTSLSYATNLALAFLCSEILATQKQQQLLKIKKYYLILIFGACLFSTYVLGARNGTIGALTIILFTSTIFSIRKINNKNHTKIAVFFTLFLAALCIYGYKTISSDQRWNSLIETIPIALDTQKNTLWAYPESDVSHYPKLSNGELVNGSNYMRIAWAKLAIEEIIRHPFGVGYTRHAFGDAIRLHTPNFVHTHSHSGVLDFTLSNGIIGLLLWLGFLTSLMRMGWVSFKYKNNPVGLLLFFVVSGFLTRSIVDSNIRDHMLEQFMFVAMTLAGIIANTASPENLKKQDTN